MLKKKLKVTFISQNQTDWLKKFIVKLNKKFKNKYSFKIEKNYKKVSKQDLVFLVYFYDILPKSFLKKNKLTLITHCSKLPRDKGFAPMQNQILRGKNKIFISIVEAINKVDSGNIYLQRSFNLKGTELYENIRKIQKIEIIKIIESFLIKYPKIKNKKQTGKENYNKRRNINNSQLNIKKSIHDQFQLLRICDNEKCPAFFIYKKKKYILKIFQEN